VLERKLAAGLLASVRGSYPFSEQMALLHQSREWLIEAWFDVGLHLEPGELQHALDQAKALRFVSLDVPIGRCPLQHFVHGDARSTNEALEAFILNYD
jgi:hypothetical protein